MAFTDMDDLRTQRNAALAASDWTILPDSPFDDGQQVVIKAYREELRDLPSMVDETDLANANLPTCPVAF